MTDEDEARRQVLRAVYEDRERIAGDVHDRVIQRVFAAGLQLQGLAPKLPADVQPQLTSVLAELDGAIVALRGAIFALLQPSVAIDTDNALHELAERATRILGFAPAVAVHASALTISRELHDDVIAVAQEALANVARHAGATAVRLELSVEGERVTLEVVDDGTGMPPEKPHSSGTGNISRRATERGGTAEWLPSEPRGTRLTWSVPLS